MTPHEKVEVNIAANKEFSHRLSAMPDNMQALYDALGEVEWRELPIYRED